MDKSSTTQNSERKKSCINCGAELTYEPGTDLITCDYCGHKEVIESPQQPFEELELNKYLSSMGGQTHATEITMLHCDNCGANQHIEENLKSLHCVYCAMPLIVEDVYTEEWIVPGAVVPFKITKEKAHQIFKKWVNNLWWAPNNLQRASLSPENTRGLYLPYWTFDAQLKSIYRGERGEYYYVSKTVGAGKNRRKVKERRTRWHDVSGQVDGFVDDTLIRASRKTGLRIPAQITRWRLDELKDFDSRFLAGYTTEKYTISLQDGHANATQEAQTIAQNWIRRDIGGDTQRIHHMEVKLTEETFKHILLPVFISSYDFNGKGYHFYINGQTGVIHGDRPYSFWKIFLAIIFGLAVIGVITYIASMNS